MKYTYREGIKREKNRRWLIVSVLGLVGGLYLLINVFSSEILYVTKPADVTAKKLIASQPNLQENRVYIPKINIDVAVVPIEGNEKLALEKGAIHRAPSSGNPKDGGNYVIAAHRFNLGYTPQQTQAKSPFYHIGKLSIDDDIYIDYDGTRYAYKVTERKSVQSTAVEIEERTETDRLTMYSCELSGPKDGREVVFAKPIGKIIWVSGKPKLQPLPVD